MRKYQRRIKTREKRSRMLARSRHQLLKLMDKTNRIEEKLLASMSPEKRAWVRAVATQLSRIAIDKLAN